MVSPHQMTIGLNVHRDHIRSIRDGSPHLMTVGPDIHRDHVRSTRDGSPHLMTVGLDIHSCLLYTSDAADER